MCGATGKAIGVLIASNKVSTTASGARSTTPTSTAGGDLALDATDAPASTRTSRSSPRRRRPTTAAAGPPERDRQLPPGRLPVSSAVTRDLELRRPRADLRRAGDRRREEGRQCYESARRGRTGRPQRRRLHRPRLLEARPRDDAGPAGPQLHEVGLGGRRRHRSSSTTCTATRRPRSPSSTVDAGSVAVGASEAATILATNDSTVTSSGGSRSPARAPRSRSTRDRDQPRPEQGHRVDRRLGRDDDGGDVAVSATNTSIIDAQDARPR